MTNPSGINPVDMRVLVKPEPQKLTNLQITLNDRQVPVELVGIARPINPGTGAPSGRPTHTPIVRLPSYPTDHASR